MATKPAALIYEQESLVKKLKRGLDNWREVTLLANSVLLWKKNYYPWIIAGSITLLFLELAYYDPSVLTSISLALLFVTLLDYFGPILSSTLWKQENWTASKERELEDICRSVAGTLVSARIGLSTLHDLKAARPNLYYTVLIVTLSMLAWIGNTVNNIFITYLVVLTTALMPGLVHNGIVQKYYHRLLLAVEQILRGGAASQKTKLH